MILRSSIDFCLFKASAADGLPLLRRLWQACHPGGASSPSAARSSAPDRGRRAGDPPRSGHPRPPA